MTAVSCNKGTGGNVSGPAAAVQTTSHHGTGTIKSLDATVPSIEIEHGDIPGLMPAMKMEFHVQNKSLLQGLKAGEQIEFTIENGVEGMKIVEIRKT
jgi:Cu(I)/Ag(I) efflux system protein CusF